MKRFASADRQNRASQSRSSGRKASRHTVIHSTSRNHVRFTSHSIYFPFSDIMTSFDKYFEILLHSLHPNAKQSAPSTTYTHRLSVRSSSRTIESHPLPALILHSTNVSLTLFQRKKMRKKLISGHYLP